MNRTERMSAGYYSAEACDLDAFVACISREVTPKDVPHAERLVGSIPVYDIAALADDFEDPGRRRVLMAEWASVLGNSAGVFVLKQAQPDHDAIDAATDIYNAVIAAEKAAGSDGADHFATAGSNDRIWNSLQKLCLADPQTFIRYFAAPAIDAASEAWLGPNYQMTAQVNLVRPGGEAQSAHRDYHLGFQTAEIGATYPAHVHDLSPLMTLQGGLAHCDMPVESGPTKLLPFSQLYRPGYMAWRRDDFRAVFEERCVQVPLDKGDALFFNPALFHAAGANTSEDIQRMANLFQVSSAFGRAMENVDRDAMCKALFTPLKEAWTDGVLSALALDAVIACAAEGYPFPTNLDTDPPVGGLAPESQAVLLKRSVLSDVADAAFAQELHDQSRRKPA